MSEEEKKAIAYLKSLIAMTNSTEDFGENNPFKILNNLIEKQQQELQLKDKVIEEMAEMLVKVPNNADNPTTAVIIENINRNLEQKKHQVIQYFINKVKGE